MDGHLSPGGTVVLTSEKIMDGHLSPGGTVVLTSTKKTRAKNKRERQNRKHGRIKVSVAKRSSY